MINSAPVVVVLQMQFYFAINHVTFAFANRRHVSRHGAGHHAELCT
jgi:hypothetical protein